MRFLRRVLDLVLIVYVVGILGMAAVAQLAPLTGHELYAVRSGSMAPNLARGDLVVVDRVPPAEIRAGDVVTFAVGSTTTVTHRVVEVTETGDGPLFATRGDANATADPLATRSEQVRGRVAGHVPFLGFLLAMLTMPSGVVALLSIGATVLTAALLADGLAAGDEARELDELRRLLAADGARALP